MRFQDAAKDGRAVVYAGIQADPLVARAATLLTRATAAERWLARAAMNGERTEADVWRRIFPSLFGEGFATELRERAELILEASLEVANRGEAARSSYRGAVVEELTARLLTARDDPAAPDAPVRRERRVRFPPLVPDRTRSIDGEPRRHATGRPRGPRRPGGASRVSEPPSASGYLVDGSAGMADTMPYRIVRPYRVRFEESTANETMRTAIHLAWVAD